MGLILVRYLNNAGQKLEYHAGNCKGEVRPNREYSTIGRQVPRRRLPASYVLSIIVDRISQSTEHGILAGILADHSTLHDQRETTQKPSIVEP